jgi:hemerythrin-like domain-containing protein
MESRRESTEQSLGMERRSFLRTVGTAGLAVAGCASTGHGAPERNNKGNEPEVTPGEDLMQEHGVLERIVLIYDEVGRRIDKSERFDPATVVAAAGIVHRFIEDYHEKNEERFIFPRLQAAKREADLVAVLLRQHQRGRELTLQIIRTGGAGGTPELARAIRSFTRMYRPHAAREDTVIFPAFRDVIGRAAYQELGDELEEQEHRILGEHGFEEAVAEVARLESTLGIADLDSFTPV